MDIRAAEKLATELMDKHGLLAKGWTFHFDACLRRFGCCSFRKKRIQLSRPLAEVNEEKDVRDTILHEIAHALCDPKVHHGPAWKAMARTIGAKPERCYDSSEVFTVKFKWYAKCKMCGAQDTVISRTNPSSWYKTCKCWNNRPATHFNVGRYQFKYRKGERVVFAPKTTTQPVAPAVPATVATIVTTAAWVNPPKSFDAGRCVELYRGGMRVVDIAVAMGYERGHGQNRVRAALIKAGVYSTTPVDSNTEK